jgi:uncharacterized protein (TIGR02246 family)
LLVAPCFGQDIPPGLQPEPTEYRSFGEPSSPEEGDALDEANRGFSEAWGSGDAVAVASYYADDAEWTNAFGDVVRGSADLQAFLTWLFSQDDEASSAGEKSNSRGISMRYLGGDVAVSHGQTTSTRGEARGGEGNRQVHVTFVWAKVDGEWKIVHQMIMDAR